MGKVTPAAEKLDADISRAGSCSFCMLQGETESERPSADPLAVALPVLVEIAETHPMDAQESLETLMTLYQQGDTRAATELIHSVSPRLYRFFAVNEVSRSQADDLLQETWLRIHRVRHTYRAGEPALAWFYAIARHVRVDHYRREMRTIAKENKLDETASMAKSVASPLRS